jgi:hypothetical protein
MHPESQMLKEVAPGITVMILFDMALQAVRDFRDNFAPELWGSFGFTTTPDIDAVSETIVGIVTFVPIFLVMWLIKHNMKTFMADHILIFCGMLFIGALTLMYHSNPNQDTGMVLMVGSGVGLYIAYVPFHNILMDLMLAVFKYVANSGFLMYVCDALGYLSSGVVVMIRNFANADLDWGNFYVILCAIMTFTGLGCMTASGVYYYFKYRWMMARLANGETDADGKGKAKEEDEKEVELDNREVQVQAEKVLSTQFMGK